MISLDVRIARPRCSGTGPSWSLLVLSGRRPMRCARGSTHCAPVVPEGTRIIGLSNLKRLPFFVPKGVVTKGLAEQLPNIPVLCDWKGRVYADLGFPAGAVISVGVFGPLATRLGIVTGEHAESRLSEVVALLPH